MITIAPPTEPQRLVVRAWLRKQLTGSGAHVRFGEVSVRGLAAREAARACEESVYDRHLLVACLDAVPGEPVGFVSFSPATDEHPLVTLHFVYVLGPDKPHGTRRLGIGLELLRAAAPNGDAGATTSTPAGEALMAALRRQNTRAA